MILLTDRMVNGFKLAAGNNTLNYTRGSAPCYGSH
jgi:hypothetical protein